VVHRHLRANAIAYLALFVALSGTAYAGVKLTLPPASVGTEQLRDGAVTKPKIAKKTIAALRGARGPRGERGLEGPQGPEGKPGLDASAKGVEVSGDLTGTFPSDLRLRQGSVSAFQIDPQIFVNLRQETWFRIVNYGPFKNGWQDVGGEYARAAWAQDSRDEVHLRGVIAGGSVPSDVFAIQCAGPDDGRTHVFATVSGNSLAKVEVRAVGDPDCGQCPIEHCTPLGYTPTDAVVRVTYGLSTSLSLDGIYWHTGKLDDAGGATPP
jgi:hypothetical protein